MAAPQDETSDAFLQREPSFSLIYFTGQVKEALPALLVSCGYSLIAQTQYQARFSDATYAIGVTDRSPNTFVYKAIYAVSGGTVLLDPEQVVGLINDDAITEFCAKHEVEAFVAIWERVSETSVARQFTSLGIRVDVMLMRGQSMNPPVNPPTELLREPGPAGLKAFLASGHAPIEEVFGNISGALLKLDETLRAPKR